MNGSEISRYPHNQSDPTELSTASKKPTFSRALGSSFSLSPHWLLPIFSLFLIGRCDYGGFRLTILEQKARKEFLVHL